jgi:hypothetical protein
MNRTQFTEFMKTPSALTSESGQLLAQVLKEFPYCQTAQLLYVKNLHLQNSIHYNNQLKIAAAYATDRSMLHALLNRRPSGTEQKPENAIPEPVPVVSRNDAQIVSSLERNPETQVPAGKSETKTPSAQDILEARLKELEELNRQAEAALEQKSALLAAEVPPPPTIELTEEIKPAEKPVSVTDDSLPARKTFIVPEPDNLVDPVQTDDTLKTVRDLETLSGTYMSAAIDDTIQIEIEQEEAELPVPEEENEVAEETRDDAELSFTDWLKKSKTAGKGKAEGTPAPEEEEKKHKETALIERFIKEEPRITKPKKEFYSPVNMARQSVVEDLSFVTETLAGIYAKQGNVAKAIRAYQTLSLKYPKKKLYFASLIEKLEQDT